VSEGLVPQSIGRESGILTDQKIIASLNLPVKSRLDFANGSLAAVYSAFRYDNINKNIKIVQAFERNLLKSHCKNSRVRDGFKDSNFIFFFYVRFEKYCK
jgi:hypothetical protein